MSVISKIDNTGPPWIFTYSSTERDADQLVYLARSIAGLDVRAVRGQRCRTVEGLWNEWSAALQFPYYFGQNWNAFFDCATDLSWLTCSKLVVVVTRATELLADEVCEQVNFLGLLIDVSEHWQVFRGDKESSMQAFHTILQSECQQIDELIGLLGRMSAPFEQLAVAEEEN